MKVLVLQWCLDIKDGYPTSKECGTIERISTTARDCVDKLMDEFNAEHYSNFVAAVNNGPLSIREDLRQPGDIIVTDPELLQNYLQRWYLDDDSLGSMWVRGEKEKWELQPADEPEQEPKKEYFWWRIQSRNLH